jgi:hypothetical protein
VLSTVRSKPAKPTTLKKIILRERKERYLAWRRSQERSAASESEYETEPDVDADEMPTEPSALAVPPTPPEEPEVAAAAAAVTVSASDDRVVRLAVSESDTDGDDSADDAEDAATAAARLEELRKYPPVPLTAPRECVGNHVIADRMNIEEKVVGTATRCWRPNWTQP